MELKNNRKWLYIATVSWLLIVLTMGIWWLYIAFTLANHIDNEQISNIFSSNFYRMLRWEGGFFLALLTITTSAVLFLFLRDHKNSTSLQKFFASLTHELKTPIANIRLQSQFLSDLLKDKSNEQINKSLDFLNSGSYELEDRFDNIMHLSKMELSGELNYESINLKRFIQSILTKHPDKSLNYTIDEETESSDILSDRYALKIIIRNLIENSIKHSKEKNINITLKKENNLLAMIYSDGGVFKGEDKKLANLFYKHNSHQGTGIGLYLIKQFVEKMGGTFTISNKDKISFKLCFKVSDA